MNVITKFLEHYSFRFPKGYPDMNNLEDKALLYEILSELNVVNEAEENTDEISAEEVKNLIDQIKDDQSTLKYIKKYILNKPSEGNLNSYLASHNIDKNTVATFNAPVKISSILSDNDDTDNFLKYTDSPISFSSLGESGNLVNVLSNSGVSTDSIQSIINLSGTEGGRGIGKGEIALATFIKDLKMSEGKGDLDWNGKYLEVKGSGARLGSRGNSSSILTNSNLGKLAVDELGTLKENIRIEVLINLLIENDISLDIVYKTSIDFLKQIFPSATNISDVFNENELNDVSKIKKAITKIYINNYANKEGVDHFIFLNTSKNFGSYLSFSPKDAEELVDKGEIVVNNFYASDLSPQISRP
jgi:hypothetical protein